MHLVAKGYVQRVGLDFEKVYTPMARLESMRLILALAAHRGWEVHHKDVKSAFLNADLDEEVLPRCQASSLASTRRACTSYVHKALYGLWQAPRAWNAKLDATLASLGVSYNASKHGVYS